MALARPGDRYHTFTTGNQQCTLLSNLLLVLPVYSGCKAIVGVRWINSTTALQQKV
jgi:hypothetical protein